MAKNKANIKGAVESRSFQKSLNQAEKYAKDLEKTTRLLERAVKKSEGLDDKSLVELWDYFKALLRLIEASVRRRYVAVPWQSLVMALAAVIYFVNPLDFIPDFIPLFGYLDDVTILAYVIRRIKHDIDAFLTWETKQLTAATGS
ncbi:MAG: YkvA family protein [Chloroflexota bacterium]